MKRFNKAFTLTELLVALGVIGILCAILLPVIFNLLPNQNTMMAKRAYYTTQTIIADLINDEACYPDLTTAALEDEVRYGFDDGLGYANCRMWNSTGCIETECSANQKFGTLFTDKLDSTEVSASDNGTSFETKDGMSWAISFTAGKDFDGAKHSDDSFAYITVDVNGDELPNCGKGTTSTAISGKTVCDSSRDKGFDVFTMSIRSDGKITIDPADDWAVKAVQINKDITEE